MSGVKFAQYVGIKYSTLAYWLQSRRRKREQAYGLGLHFKIARLTGNSSTGKRTNDKPISLVKGESNHDREFTISNDAPLGQ